VQATDLHSMQAPDHTAPDPQRRRIVTAAFVPAMAVLLLWCVHLLADAFAVDLARFGLLPRQVAGLPGILLAPFIHGDLGHLFNNSVPLLVLGWCLVYFYPRAAGRVTLGVWLLTGLWVWISARGDRHIGASGVVYGLAAFLFASGVLRRQRALMAIALLVAFLYGGLIWGVFPIVPRMSWESHLWGALSGVAMAIVYRRVPPAFLPDRTADSLDEPGPGGEGEQGAEIPVQQPRIVYSTDPGDEVDEDADRWKRDLQRRVELDARHTDSTWPFGGGDLPY